MTSRNLSLLPTWPVSPQREPLYGSLNAGSRSSTIGVSSVSDSIPNEDSPSSPCLDQNASNNKALPRPPSRIHPFRHSVMTLWYRRLKKLEGYHFGVLCCAGVAAVVLCINLILIIWVISSLEVQNGLGTLQDGNCKRTASLTFWAHLVINILSTLLLGASNYSMQCLSSPTRGEIDKAHNKGVWLDIGVPSVRNLRRLSTTRVTLWWLLAISSIPLHLLYNSAVFSTLCSNQYDVFLVSSDFVNGAPFSHDFFGDLEVDALNDLRAYQKNQTSLERLEKKKCVEVYTAPIISSYSDLLLVSTHSNVTNSLLYEYSDISLDNNSFDDDSFTMCLPFPVERCDTFAPDADLHNWLQYCLCVPAKEHCKLQFSLVIMIVVIVCNLIKTVCMSTIAWKQDPEPLVTLGDAIASFLDRPDVKTEGNCTAQKGRFEKSKSWDLLSRRWGSKSLLLFRAASSRRWIVCNILCISTLIVAGTLLRLGLNNPALHSRSILHLWSLGLGNVSPETLIAINDIQDLSDAGGVILIVLVANSPQIILSFLYFSYNGIFTCMLLSKEWSTYGTQSKFLRVTTPTGRQRSTYRLQLPYRYGVPLLIGSGTLHWLVSQSIFLVRVNFIDSHGVEDADEGISTCGYSPIAIIFVIILGSIVVLVGIANGFRKVSADMPLAGSCSAAISAACHPPKADVNASLKRVMWGVVAEGNPNDSVESVGHCSFTSFKVEAPIVGRKYAGQQKQ